MPNSVGPGPNNTSRLIWTWPLFPPFRGLAPEDDPAVGLWARLPGAGNAPAGQVAGKRPSQWISTTLDEEIARNKYGEYGVVEIDLSKVNSAVVDFSNGIPGIKGSQISNWAKKDKEVLIKDFIPPDAIKAKAHRAQSK